MWSRPSGEPFRRQAVMQTAPGKRAPKPAWKEVRKGDAGRENSLCKGTGVWMVRDGERGSLKGKQRKAQEGAWCQTRVYWENQRTNLCLISGVH